MAIFCKPISILAIYEGTSSLQAIARLPPVKPNLMPSPYLAWPSSCSGLGGCSPGNARSLELLEYCLGHHPTINVACSGPTNFYIRIFSLPTRIFDITLYATLHMAIGIAQIEVGLSFEINET